MRILAIETATEACSIALFDNGECLAADHHVLGRGHAEQLVPMIAALPDHGRAERIVVSLGPGSFTGARIGIATARALGIAWDAEVLGYPTMALVAAIAQQGQPRGVTVCMNGGHGEYFVQNFAADSSAQDDVHSLPPEQAKWHRLHPLIAGNRASELADLCDAGTVIAQDILPDASAIHLLPTTCFTQRVSPIYGRGPDAKLPA